VAEPRNIDDLYALAPEGFIAARDALARSLKQAGDAEAAASVKKLRRPSVVAWALNQLARRDRKGLDELVAAGETLRSAQRKAMSGVKESGFREATDRRRQLVQDLTRRTMDILAEAGRGGQAEDEIGQALEAASVDRSAAEQLLAGRLERPPTASGGFEAVSGFEVFQGGGDEPEAREGASDAEREGAEVAVRNAERQADEAAAEARRAVIRAEHLETQAREVAERAEEARGEAERLERRAEEARSKLEQARHDLDALG
jgi:hypothetical protein